MSSTKEYIHYVLEQLDLLENITCRPMMGEYLLYCDRVLFGGIYNDRLLIKRTANNQAYGMEEQIPYPGAKPMYMPSQIEDKLALKEIVLCTCQDLKASKK